MRNNDIKISVELAGIVVLTVSSKYFNKMRFFNWLQLCESLFTFTLVKIVLRHIHTSMKLPTKRLTTNLPNVKRAVSVFT